MGIAEDALAEIDAAFAGAPRPSNDALLHDDCFDGNDSGDAAVDSTIWSLALNDRSDARMRAFTRSKWSELDDAQRPAVLSFLRAAGALDDERADDVARALPAWDGSHDGAGDAPAAARAAIAEAGGAAVEAWFEAANARDEYALGELVDDGQVASVSHSVVARPGLDDD